MKFFKYLCVTVAVFSSLQVFAQQDSLHQFKKNKTDSVKRNDTVRQIDGIDLLSRLFKIKDASNGRQNAAKANFSVVPNVGYSLTTGVLVDISGNVGFYTTTDHDHQNLSDLDEDLNFDSNAQKVALLRGEIWGRANDYKFVVDVRWEKFPENTYGIGTLTTNDKANHINFNYQRTYLTFYKKIVPDNYWGLGYQLDYHYGISEDGTIDQTVSDFKKYGEPNSSISSGLNLSYLYDSRKNPINPKNGAYLNLTFRQNMSFLGSTSNWSAVKLDVRKYLKLSPTSDNILAFWSILWFTQENVPYLDLPATAEDMFNNTGRGYVQDRFIGKKMLYVESEYRFGLTANGLLGGVVFANAESLSEYQTNTFKSIAPAVGTGLRLKFNKHSNTNLCIDYGYGFKGSKGFFLNLGEVF
jgi:outer membrane protein assembly factor BamA